MLKKRGVDVHRNAGELDRSWSSPPNQNGRTAMRENVQAFGNDEPEVIEGKLKQSRKAAD